MSTSAPKLDLDLSVPTQIIMTRAFAAPRRLVVRAMSEPDLMARWMGGRRAEVVSATIDRRVGGAYRYAYRAHGSGYQFAFRGVFREVSDERTVYVEEFEGMPGEVLVTTTLIEEAGVTTMRLVMEFPSREVRDLVVRTGMADGAGESYDHLDALLTTLA